MNPEEIVENGDTVVSQAIQDTVEIVEQVSDYGFLIANSLIFIVGGMLVIFFLHMLASRFLYPRIHNTRVLKVLFGTLYMLILVVAMLLVLKRLGFDVSSLGKLSILAVLLGAVGVFFLVPFLPRLPFKIGHMIEVSGVLGIVQGISTYHTTLQTFDGKTVFVPNALLMAGKIINYHDTPQRRIELALEAGFDSDIAEIRTQLLKIMSNDERVLDSPAPRFLLTGADASGAKISGFCWVKNGDWLAARSDLWLALLNAFASSENISLSRPEQDVYLINAGESAPGAGSGSKT